MHAEDAHGDPGGAEPIGGADRGCQKAAGDDERDVAALAHADRPAEGEVDAWPVYRGLAGPPEAQIAGPGVRRDRSGRTVPSYGPRPTPKA